MPLQCCAPITGSISTVSIVILNLIAFFFNLEFYIHNCITCFLSSHQALRWTCSGDDRVHVCRQTDHFQGLAALRKGQLQRPPLWWTCYWPSASAPPSRRGLSHFHPVGLQTSSSLCPLPAHDFFPRRSRLKSLRKLP